MYILIPNPVILAGGKSRRKKEKSHLRFEAKRSEEQATEIFLSWLARWGVAPRVASTGTGNRREEEKRGGCAGLEERRPRPRPKSSWLRGGWVARCCVAVAAVGLTLTRPHLRSTNAHTFHAPRPASHSNMGFWKRYFFRHSVR